MFRNLVGKVVPSARRFTTSAVRSSDHDSLRGVPGTNLPFQIENRYRLMVVFVLYFGSGLGLPFLNLRYMIKKKNQS